MLPTVLITGASRGLGAALLRTFAEAGHPVVGVARHPAALHAVVDDLRRRGLAAHAVQGDVANPDTTAALIGEAVAKAGPIGVLINNASILGQTPLPLLLDMEDRSMNAVFQANTLGPWRLMKAVAGPMVLRGHGLIVNISSDAAVHHYPTWGGYGASKAALDHLTATLAAELDGTGVRLLAVDPGEMHTQMHRDAVPDADPDSLADPADVAVRLVRAMSAGASGRISLPALGVAS